MVTQPDIHQQIQQVIHENRIVLFMKGSKSTPSCGFSNTAVQVLNSMGVDFVTVNVLQNQQVREGIKQFSNWPTIPQLYINGEFIGGADIILELYRSGELQEKIEKSLAS